MPPVRSNAVRLSTTSDEGFARNPEYVLFAPLWMKCRDASAGQDAIHAKHRIYLPQLSGMDNQDYEQYLRRAMFFNAMGRTASGLTGTVMRKPITIEYPEAQRDALDSLGVSDESVEDLIARTIHTQLVTGRVGHLVDAPPEGNDGMPFVSEYKAEAIWNWHQERIDGKMLLTLVVLHELDAQLDGVKHTVKVRDRFRVLRLGIDPAVIQVSSDVRDEQGNLKRDQRLELADGFSAQDIREPFYFQEIWVFVEDEKGEQTDELVLQEIIVPKKAGGRLWTEIPFQFTNVGSDEPSPEKPPLLDLVNVNLSHYMNSADLEWGRHWTALPTPWVAGGNPKEPPRIGSATAWVMPDSDAKVGMLEFSGAGLGHLQTGMEHKEQLMAVLGSRVLEDNKAGVEAAEAIKLRLTGDSAVLAAISREAGSSWSKILRWVWEWTNMGDPTDITVTLNTDFNPARLPAAELQALMLSFQAGLIDFNTWFYNLEKGEILAPGTTKEELEAGIQEGIPGAPTVPDNTAGMLDDPEATDDPDDPDEPDTDGNDEADV